MKKATLTHRAWLNRSNYLPDQFYPPIVQFLGDHSLPAEWEVGVIAITIAAAAPEVNIFMSLSIKQLLIDWQMKATPEDRRVGVAEKISLLYQLIYTHLIA